MLTRPSFFFALLPIFWLPSLTAAQTASAPKNIQVKIETSDELLRLNRSEIRLATEDARRLLDEASICLDCQGTDTVVLVLTLDPSPPKNEPAPKPYPVLKAQPSDYEWKSDRDERGQLRHTLYARSPFGVACGVYGLLQEGLGFAFYHPRETYVPDLTKHWPLNETFTLRVDPKFPKRGFHLHTMHPIELAEPLFNPQLPGALNEVKEYIDWLARNEQNIFEFCLMESIDRKTWIEHAKAFTAYGHSRGILMSVDISLHMIQQKSFQLYENPPASFRSKKAQIRRNMDWLFQCPWDIASLEFNAAEFLTGNAEKRNELRRFVLEECEKHGVKLMGRQHVVKESNDLVRSKTEGKQHEAADPARGVLAHTVMFYSMTEPHAPVYENENQRHVFEFLKRENNIRETWYYPESAYWVTFDNSVPVYPLPYLSARLSDIDTAAAYGVEGHLTFSSGWELGYWLFDWSIARWSRRVTLNEQLQKNTPAQYTYGNPFRKEAGPLVDSLLAIQEEYLKGKNLMAYMTAQTVTDEIPQKLRREFHPRPPFTYGWLRNKSGRTLRDSVEKYVITELKAFSARSAPFSQQLFALQNTRPGRLYSPAAQPAYELGTVLDITQKRALHRSLTLGYLLSVSRHKSGDGPKTPELLDEAAHIRENAQILLNSLRLRYDRERLTGKFPNGTAYTSYDFGYLYTAYRMHFWKREEEQAKKNRYDFLFRNIWNVFRIVGLQD